MKLTAQPVNAGVAAHVTTPAADVLGASALLVCILSGSGQKAVVAALALSTL
jgi:hypothetical protein